MDTAVFQFFYNLLNISPALDGFFLFFAKYLPYLVFLAFLIVLFQQKNKIRRFRTILFTIIAVALSNGLILSTLHFFISRERPYMSLDLEALFIPLRDASLPSGHAAFFALLATIVFLRISNQNGLWFYLAALLISLSRVVAGVHWPSDILLGAIIGISIPIFLHFFLEAFRKDS